MREVGINEMQLGRIHSEKRLIHSEKVAERTVNLYNKSVEKGLSYERQGCFVMKNNGNGYMHL